MKTTILFLILLTAACSSVKIKGVQKADGFSIANYKTFSFYEVSTEGDAIGPNSQANLKLIKEAIAKEMEQRGVSMVADHPDLHVNIGIVVMHQVQTVETSFTNPSDRTHYMGTRNYSWQSTEKVVGTYRDGSVIVHLVDQATNKLVWQGVAQSVLPEKEKNVPALIQEAIKSLFAKVQ
jgi:hypothetical protein